MTSIADLLKTAGIIAVASISQLNGIQDSTSNGIPAIVNVYSEFCGYSHKMAPIFKNYIPMTGNKNIAFYGADANEIEGLTSKLDIKGVPAFIGYACGKELKRVVGADENGLSELMTELGNAKC